MKTIVDNPWLRYLAVTCLVFSCLMVTGCGGCRNNEDDDQAKKEDEQKKKRPKDPFETNTPILLPGIYPKPKKSSKEDDSQETDPLAEAMRGLASRDTIQNRTKLGHWYTANFQAIANNFDADGQLTAFGADGNARPVAIPATDYFLSTSRPVSLPKGEWKNFQTNVYLPPREKRVSNAFVNYTMNRSSSGLAQISLSQPTQLMKPHAYHMVLMSNRPDTYSYLNLADCIRLRAQRDNGDMMEPFYYIVPTMQDNPVPLPQHALNWTTIAYLIWDDYDPDSLAPEYQEAILDWIHFGGQLIVSGPDCLDKLQSSFLAEYLPAHFEGSRNLTRQDLQELNEHWTVKSTRNEAEKRIFQISDRVPLLGITFKPHVDANFIEGTGEIAIERKIGRGRIAVSAFSLNAPAVRKWRSFKSFLNGALLRKPSRRFGKSDDGEVVFEWADDGTSLFDPMIHSTLRFLSRDLSVDGTSSVADVPWADANDVLGNGSVRPINLNVDDSASSTMSLQDSKHRKSERNLKDGWHYGGYQDAPESGTGGWNDNSGISVAARETLKEAAGITPPSSDFVLKMLAVYLIVLVPLNWLVFRLMGKVEYAWVAAPLIAIAGAVVVVKMAALDIGFVRSNTQIGLLEIHADYSRAHLAEYSALYTSLSTRYDAELDNLSAQSLPFGTVNQNETFVGKESISQVQLRRTVSNSLEGFQIQSNSTGLLHTEYMLDLGGVISFNLQPGERSILVTNSTTVNLTDAAVMGRNEDGELEFAWLGTLDADGESERELEPIEFGALGLAWKSNPTFENSLRSSRQIWANNLANANDATLEQIAGFPEIQSNWPRFERVLLQMSPANVDRYSNQQFNDVFQLVNSKSTIRLGRILDVVLKNLTFSPGEYRLIGATNQRLGHTVFDPKSTQVDQQTLVVTHLKQGSLPVAAPDKNAYEDLVTRSNLNWLDTGELEDQIEFENQ